MAGNWARSPATRFYVNGLSAALELSAELEAVPGVKVAKKCVLAPDNAAWLIESMLAARGIVAKRWDPPAKAPRGAREAVRWLHPMVVEPGFLTSYQREGIATALRWPNESGLFVWSAGSGKSLGALALTLTRGPSVTVVVTKAAIRPTWIREITTYTRGVEWRELTGEKAEGLGLILVPPRPLFLITGYDTLPAWIGALEALRPTTVIFDECFPAGTPVLTIGGERPIESIRRGELVVAQNSEGMWGFWPADPIVTHSRSPMVRVKHEMGSFITTASHEVWTEEKGYVCAKSLGGLHLQIVRKDSHRCSAGQQAHPADLLEGVRGSMDGALRENAPDRSAERIHLSSSRVVRVEVLECGGGERPDSLCDRDRLYDLQVEGAGSYVASGVLVHNCHRAKSHQRYEAITEWDAGEGEASGVVAIPLTPESKAVSFRIKDNQSAACYRLSRASTHRLGLTATPIRDRVRDLWAQLDLVRPWDFGGFWNFACRYCAAVENPFGGMDTRGSSNLAELKKRLAFVCHNVPHALANRSLPPVRRLVTRIPISQQNRPSAIKVELRGALKRGQDAVREALLMEAASRKRRVIADHVCDAIDGALKICIFTGRRIDVESLAKEIAKKRPQCPIWTGTGADAVDARDAARIAFMASPGPAVFVATGESMGEGLDMQDVDLGILAMIPCTPGQVVQYEGRWVRLGMKRPVLIRYFIAEGTIDEHMSAILLDKLPAIEKTVDLDEIRGLTSELRGDEGELLKSMAMKVLGG